MLRIEQGLVNAPDVIENKFSMKAAEVGADGEAVKFDATGTLTKCAATDAPEYLLTAAAVAGGKTEHIMVSKNHIVLVDYTGATPVVGQKYCLDATALKLDGDTVLNGKLHVLQVDTIKKKARVRI